MRTHPLFLGGPQGQYIRRESLVSAAINMAMSAAFFYGLFAHLDAVPIWTPTGYAFDFVPQSFFCALLSALIPGIMARRRLADGSISPHPSQKPARHSSAIGYSLRLGLLTTAVSAGLAACLLALSGLSELSFGPALAVKILFGAVLGLLVTPIAISRAMAEATNRR